MKDKKVKLEEIEASLTVGGAGEGRVQGRGKRRWFGCYSGVKHTKGRAVCGLARAIQFITTDKAKASRGGGKVSVL